MTVERENTGVSAITPDGPVTTRFDSVASDDGAAYVSVAATDAPIRFCAVTANVYTAPLVRPVTEQNMSLGCANAHVIGLTAPGVVDETVTT